MKSPSLNFYPRISNLGVTFLAILGACLLANTGIGNPLNNPLIPPTITVSASGPIYTDVGDVNNNDIWDKNDPGPLTPSPPMTSVSFTVTYGTGSNDYKSGITYIGVPAGCNAWEDSAKVNPLPTQYQNYSFNPPLSFYLEGLNPALGPRGTAVTLYWVSPDGTTAHTSKTIELGDFQADLRVDSLNIGDAPSGLDLEDQVEFSTNTMYPGKFIPEDPNFASGLGIANAPISDPTHLIPMTINAIAPTFDPTQATFNLTYQQSIPRLTTDGGGSITATLSGGSSTFTLGMEGLRVWKSDATTHNPKSILDGGDFIPSGVDIPMSKLSGNPATVYLQYVAPVGGGSGGQKPINLTVKQTIPAGTDATVDPEEVVTAPDNVNVFLLPVQPAATNIYMFSGHDSDTIELTTVNAPGLTYQWKLLSSDSTSCQGKFENYGTTTWGTTGTTATVTFRPGVDGTPNINGDTRQQSPGKNTIELWVNGVLIWQRPIEVIQILPRSTWGAIAPDLTSMSGMPTINAFTVHHSERESYGIARVSG